MTQKLFSHPEPQKQAYWLHTCVSSSYWNRRVYFLEELTQISVLLLAYVLNAITLSPSAVICTYHYKQKNML